MARELHVIASDVVHRSAAEPGLQSPAVSSSSSRSPAVVSGGFCKTQAASAPFCASPEGFIGKLSGTGTSLLGDGEKSTGWSGKDRSPLQYGLRCSAEPYTLPSNSCFKIRSAGFVLVAIKWLTHHFFLLSLTYVSK